MRRKTRTYKYLYKVFKVAYLSTDFQIALNRLKCRQNENFTNLNVFMQDKNFPGSSIEDSIFYIIVDTRNPRFEDAISKLQECPYFMGVYQYHDVRSDLAVVRVRHPIVRQWKALLESRYSDLYKKSDGSVFFINNDSEIMGHFKEIDPNTKKAVYNKEWHVMMRTEEYFNTKILPLTVGLSPNDIEEIKKNEFDDKINLKEETINSQQKYNHHEKAERREPLVVKLD